MVRSCRCRSESDCRWRYPTAQPLSVDADALIAVKGVRAAGRSLSGVGRAGKDLLTA